MDHKFVLDKLPYPVAIVYRNGAIEYINPKMAETLGYAVEDIPTIKRCIELIIPDDNKKQADVLKQWERNAALADTKNIEPQTLCVTCRNGTVRSVISDLACLDCDRLLYSMLDISTQEQSRITHSRYQLVSELISDYAYSVEIDSNGVPTTSWLIGAFEKISEYTLEELQVPNAISQLVHPEDTHLLTRSMQSLQKGKALSNETRLVTKSGKIKWVRDRMKPLMDQETGRLCGVIGAVEEITELVAAREREKQMEQQAWHIQRIDSLGQLASGIAHDCNNMLVGILGNVELCLAKTDANSLFHSSLEKIRTGAMNLRALAGQMLEYSGKGSSIVERVDLSKTSQEMMNIIDVALNKNTRLSANFGKNLPLVNVNRSQLQQVVLNIIKNASDAIGKNHGTVKLETGVIFAQSDLLRNTYVNDNLPEGEYVYLKIADDGIGMDEITKQKLFDPFYTTKSDGHGLGMASVLGIVRRYRGAIIVDSKPGEGTTVIVYLPVFKKPLSPYLIERQDNSNIELKKCNRAPLILILDNDPIARGVVSEMLTREGYRVISMASDQKDIEEIEEADCSIEAVILDPGRTKSVTAEAYTSIRARWPGVPVFLLSAYPESEVDSIFSSSEVVAFIQKPFLMNTLLTTLTKFIGRDLKN